jgi:hypothetical protein
MTTEIRESVFSIDLPGEWEPAESPEPGTVLYREKDGSKNLSVMLLEVKPSFTIADPRMLLEQYMSHRQLFERAHAESLVMSEPRVMERDGAVEGSWDGYEFATGRMITHYTVRRSSLLADFTYEAFGLDPMGFAREANETFATLVVTEPAS